ncbi:hypothetical protein Ctob_015264 [Chrysochromulina tobinii]|uniref:Uncharacterized protein n=1 Tax=Chrysochromulina tobinii TaxID=1460289 RepID=A0A0M0KB80_9EUKA|nr:hypothetical protein Ctob_015264 [Chrysochromulina tobinii]|eukprot:KOO36034.1 hypothetical protein Ctob_015264 [Chrysochromulina sp. CCMP291]
MASQTALTPSSLRLLEDKSRAVSPPMTGIRPAMTMPPSTPTPFPFRSSSVSELARISLIGISLKFSILKLPRTAAASCTAPPPAMLFWRMSTRVNAPLTRRASAIAVMPSACLADGFGALLLQLVLGERQLRQRACDGYHSRHSVCSNWTDAIVLEAERRELGLLVTLDGLADCAYALIREVVVGQIQGRQPAHDGYESRHDHTSLDADALPLQVQLRERVGAHLLERDLVEHLDLEVAEDSG